MSLDLQVAKVWFSPLLFPFLEIDLSNMGIAVSQLLGITSAAFRNVANLET
jgi:hypothetical protein